MDKKEQEIAFFLYSRKLLISYYIKNAIIAIAFEISSLHSETQIGENKGRLKSLCSCIAKVFDLGYTTRLGILSFDRAK